MKKIILVVVALLIATPVLLDIFDDIALSDEDRWTYYGVDAESNKRYYDTKSLTFIDKHIVRVWEKRLFPDRGISVKKEVVRENGALGLTGLKGYYVVNKKEGRVFVIEGKLVNPWNFPTSSKSVKGSVFDGNGVKVSEKLIFPNIIFSKQQLRELSPFDLEKTLSQTKNVDLAPGTSLPFMVVFSNVPGNLSEFEAEVSGQDAERVMPLGTISLVEMNCLKREFRILTGDTLLDDGTKERLFRTPSPWDYITPEMFTEVLHNIVCDKEKN